jgi:uncharacterized protein (DUF486 family)
MLRSQETMHTILLLTISNIFMTFAWYGHLKYKDSPLWIVILVSWGIAFIEYYFQVPANWIRARALVIHGGSSRNHADTLRGGRVETRGKEAYSSGVR